MADAVDAKIERSPAQSHPAWLSKAAAAARDRIRIWAAQESRIGLWAPAVLGAGAASYFLAHSEPAPLTAPAMLATAVIAARLAERLRLPALAAAFFCAGFIAADLRAAIVDAPVIARETRFATVEGRLVSIEEAPKQRRLIIEVSAIENVAAEVAPERIRVSWRGREFAASPGDTIQLRASLSPPPGPAAPGGFDFGRQLYFQRIGAVGYAVSAPQITARATPSAASVIESVRVQLSRRILEKAPGDSGAIVAAVITGKRGQISDEAEAAFRDSGLAHLLSISGLHMGLATGLIFFGVRAMLATIESVALRYPIKKWAAAAALLSGFFYLLISGAAWPAQRAFIMSSIFFIAILADRRALTLRNVAIAAFIIILVTPEAVLHPGFQMSFAAVTALIAFYEWASARADPLRSFGWTARLRRYAVGIAITDTIAAAATAPYSLYHFNRAANFGLAANLVSIPIMGFWVMPAAIVAMILIPFGADGPIWRLAAAGVEIILVMGRWTIGLPGAVTVFPQWPPAALGVITMGGLWLCLMTAKWRLAGLASLPVATILIATTPHPQLFFSDEGDNAGVIVETETGARRFAVFDARKSRFDSGVWMEQAGFDAKTEKPSHLADFADCDRSGCVVELSARRIAFSRNPMGLADDCARADLVVATYPVSDRERRGCKSALIDRRDAWRKGAHAVYLETSGFRIETVRERRGDRPWIDG